MTEEFPISQSDWMKQKATILTRIEELRDRLEQPNIDINLTRGEIQSLRWIIDIAEPAVTELTPRTNYT